MQTMNAELKQSVDVLCKALAEDKTEGDSYYYSWQANIAVCVQDEMHRWMERNNTGVITKNAFHEISNRAAREFLDLLIMDHKNLLINN